MSQEQQAELYEQGYRAIVATFNDTVTMHALAEDGSIAWIGCNQDVTNLIDNPDFAIAQAGYGGTHGTQVYAADRWGIYSADAEYSIQGKAKEIVLSVTSGAISIFQHVQKLPAGSYTCGFYTPDGPSFVELNTTIPDFDMVECAFGAGLSVTLNGAFLYEGSYTTKTLPPWVAPDPIAEFIKCRRYFRKEELQYSILPYYFSTTERYYWIELYVKMRIAPSIIYNNQDGEYNDGWTKTGSTLTVDEVQPYRFRIHATGGNVTTSNRPFLFVSYQASADL